MAVHMRQIPTTNSPSPNISSTCFLKNTPTMPTGMQLTSTLHTYTKSGLPSNLKNPAHSLRNMGQRMTMVDSTVAKCTMTSNCNCCDTGRSTPSMERNIARWPLELMGRYSDAPCTMPSINAFSQSISLIILF